MINDALMDGDGGERQRRGDWVFMIWCVFSPHFAQIKRGQKEIS
jgi:hypothetical protein